MSRGIAEIGRLIFRGFAATNCILIREIPVSMITRRLALKLVFKMALDAGEGLESALLDQRMRAEKHKTNFETLKTNHLMLQDVR